jgi:hypothetical protein
VVFVKSPLTFYRAELARSVKRNGKVVETHRRHTFTVEKIQNKKTRAMSSCARPGGIAMPKKAPSTTTRAVPVNMRQVTKQGTRSPEEFAQDLILIVRQQKNKLAGLELRKEKLNLDNLMRRQQITALQLAPLAQA